MIPNLRNEKYPAVVALCRYLDLLSFVDPFCPYSVVYSLSCCPGSSGVLWRLLSHRFSTFPLPSTSLIDDHVSDTHPGAPHKSIDIHTYSLLVPFRSTHDTSILWVSSGFSLFFQVLVELLDLLLGSFLRRLCIVVATHWLTISPYLLTR
jgi:hypothetical protein